MNTTKTTKELRNEARAIAKEKGEPTTWIVSAGATDLTHYIETGESPKGSPTDSMLNALAAEIASRAKLDAEIDADSVRAIVAEEIAKSPKGLTPEDIAALIAKGVAGLELFKTHKIELIPATETAPAVLTTEHKHFLIALAVAKLRIPLFLAGPAGTGKTTAGVSISKARGLPFYSKSVGEQTTETSLMGYMDAHGTYRGTVFRKAYEEGGVFVLDEIDGGNPAVLIVLNSALANDSCSFPDGMVARHPDFICIATANTLGQGATREYVGRNPIDAATLDRFAFLDWPIDTDLEMAVAGITSKGSAPVNPMAPAGTKVDLAAYVGHVGKIRAAAEATKTRMIVSPRASKYGADMLRAGMDKALVLNLLIWNKVDGSAAARVKNHVAA
jgi:MoxR-like ATPase